MSQPHIAPGRLLLNRCEQCRFWEKDYGTFCVNGWTGADRDEGFCHVEPRKIPMKGIAHICRYGEPR